MSAWFPFISIRSHREVIAAKDETISLQREAIKQLTDSLESFRETMKAVRTAASAPAVRRVRPADEQKPTAQGIDYLAIDPANNQAIVDAAKTELGPGRHTATMVMRRAESIKSQILATRAAQAARPPMTVKEAPPADIAELIENAEQQGIAAAAEVK